MTTRFAALAVFSHVIAQYYSIRVRHAAFNAFSLEVRSSPPSLFLLPQQDERRRHKQAGKPLI